MPQLRKPQLLLLLFVLAMAGAALGLRLLPDTRDWAPLFDIGTLLGFVAFSFGLERSLGGGAPKGA